MARRSNRGWFRKGHDSRRHIFSAEERSRGGRVAWLRAMRDEPWLLAWLQRRIDRTARPETLRAYRQRRRQVSEE